MLRAPVAPTPERMTEPLMVPAPPVASVKDTEAALPPMVAASPVLLWEAMATFKERGTVSRHDPLRTGVPKDPLWKAFIVTFTVNEVVARAVPSPTFMVREQFELWLPPFTEKMLADMAEAVNPPGVEQELEVMLATGESPSTSE